MEYYHQESSKLAPVLYISIYFLRILALWLPRYVSELAAPPRKVNVSFDLEFYHCDAGEVWKMDSDNSATYSCELCTDVVHNGVEVKRLRVRCV